MPFIPASGVAKFDMIQEQNGQTIVNTLFWKFVVSLTEAVLSDAADALRVWFIDQLNDFLSTQNVFKAVRATDQTSVSGPSVLNIYTDSPGGVSEGTGLPNNAALAVKFATAKRGRSFRGRNFIAGIPASALVSGDADHITSTFQGNLLGAYAVLPDALTSVDPDAKHVVVSRFSGGSPRAVAVVTDVIEYQINDALDSQRRRLFGRGT